MAEFPDESITDQVTIVVPVRNVVGASLITNETAQLSAVVAVPKFTDCKLHDAPASRAKSDGAVIVGLTTSITLTVKLQD